MSRVFTQVSVLMPVFNGADYLREAIDSILGQTVQDFEFVIVDDGSTDETAEIIANYDDPRIMVLRNATNMGTTASLNRGLRFVRGEYVARMDADDVSMPHRLARQCSFMDANPDIAVCGSHVMTCGKHSQVVRRPLGTGAVKCFLLAGPPFSHSSVMMRMSVLKRFGLTYDEQYRTAQDYDLWLRLLRFAPGDNLDEVLLKHRIHDRQVSLTLGDDQSRNAEQIRKQVLRSIGIDASDDDLVRHTALFRHTLEPTTDNYSWAEAWLAEIVVRNRNTGFFDPQALSLFLDETFDSYRKSCCRTETAEPGKQSLLHRIFNRIR